MIQKYIKGWRQRKRYERIRNATIKIQSLYRGLCARRLAFLFTKCGDFSNMRH